MNKLLSMDIGTNVTPVTDDAVSYPSVTVCPVSRYSAMLRKNYRWGRQRMPEPRRIPESLMSLEYTATADNG